jgi:hypothetical protein
LPRREGREDRKRQAVVYMMDMRHIGPGIVDEPREAAEGGRPPHRFGGVAQRPARVHARRRRPVAAPGAGFRRRLVDGEHHWLVPGVGQQRHGLGHDRLSAAHPAVVVRDDQDAHQEMTKTA